MSVEVRWRLFARDVVSIMSLADSGSDHNSFTFGRPLRPIRGLRLLGVVVHRSRAAVESGPAAGGDPGDREGLGILGVDDGTGVVEVRLSPPLWDSVALGDQVDVVGRLERSDAGSRPFVVADGCHVETDPNVAELRALECIKLYKLCYFSRDWSPSAIPLPPLRPDLWEENAVHLGAHPAAGDCETQRRSERYPSDQRRETSGDHGGRIGVRGSNTVESEAASKGNSRDGGVALPGVSLEERISAVISSLAGGATADQLHSALGVPPGDAGVESALAQMQLEGAIYVVEDRYMPL